LSYFFKLILLGFILLEQIAPAFGGKYDRPTHGGFPDANSTSATYALLTRAVLDSNSDQVRRLLRSVEPVWSAAANPLAQVIQSGPAQGWTLLALASAKGDVEIVEALLKHGAQSGQMITVPVGAGLNKSFTPLALAAMQGNSEVMKSILNSSKFKHQDYVREISVASQLLQPSLLAHLRLAQESRLLTEDSQRLLWKLNVPARGTLEYEKYSRLKAYPGDLLAQAHTDICPICREIPGTGSAIQLINGQMQTGDYVGPECCQARFCKSCFQEYQSSEGTENPGCPGCRRVSPKFVEFNHVIEPLSWRGEKVEVPESPRALIFDKESGLPPRAEGTSNGGAGGAAPSAVHGIEEFQGAPGILPVSDDHPRRHKLSREFADLGPIYEAVGLFWSGIAPRTMGYQEAVGFCASLGGRARLPTRGEYIALSRAMGSRQPDSDAPSRDVAGYDRSRMPDFADRDFWSASVHSVYADSAYYFSGMVGDINSEAFYEGLSVRCVRSLSSNSIRSFIRNRTVSWPRFQ